MQYKCPSCNNIIDGQVETCPYCGQSFTYQQQNPAIPPQQAAYSAPYITQQTMPAYVQQQTEEDWPKWAWHLLWLFFWPAALIALLVKKENHNGKATLRFWIKFYVIFYGICIVIGIIFLVIGGDEAASSSYDDYDWDSNYDWDSDYDWDSSYGSWAMGRTILLSDGFSYTVEFPSIDKELRV